MIVAASVQDEINGIINVCTGKPQSLADRVERFLQEKHYKIKLDYGAFPDRPYDSPARGAMQLKLTEFWKRNGNEKTRNLLLLREKTAMWMILSPTIWRILPKISVS